MFESVKNPGSLFGVIMQPLIEANATAGDSELSKTPEKFFTVFGKCMYYVLCVHAVECGFSKRYMRKAYLRFIYNWWKRIIILRYNNEQNVIENFWQDGYPIVKHFPNEWIKVMLVAITPRWVINVIYNIYKTFKKDK